MESWLVGWLAGVVVIVVGVAAADVLLKIRKKESFELESQSSFLTWSMDRRGKVFLFIHWVCDTNASK